MWTAPCYQTEYGVTLSVDGIMDGVNAMPEQYYRSEAPLKPMASPFTDL